MKNVIQQLYQCFNIGLKQQNKVKAEHRVYIDLDNLLGGLLDEQKNAKPWLTKNAVEIIKFLDEEFDWKGKVKIYGNFRYWGIDKKAMAQTKYNWIYTPLLNCAKTAADGEMPVSIMEDKGQLNACTIVTGDVDFYPVMKRLSKTMPVYSVHSNADVSHAIKKYAKEVTSIRSVLHKYCDCAYLRALSYLEQKLNGAQKIEVGIIEDNLKYLKDSNYIGYESVVRFVRSIGYRNYYLDKKQIPNVLTPKYKTNRSNGNVLARQNKFLFAA